MVAAIVATAVVARPRWAILILVGLGTAFVLFDMSRLQPWFYQYLCMFLILAAVRWDEPEPKRVQAAWGACSVVVAGIYFWSGMQKFNGAFFHDVFPWLLRPVVGERWAELLQPYAPIGPFFEASLGVLLLIPRTRSIGLFFAVGMHGFLLLILGPLGYHYNSTVWPWNFWMAAMAFILFWRSPLPLFGSAIQMAFGRVAIVAFAILPSLNFADSWDGFLSASFYSGRLQDGWILLNEKGRNQLPARYARGNAALKMKSGSQYLMDITQWATGALNVPPYAEPRIYQAVMVKLRQAGVEPKNMALFVRERPTLTGADRAYTVIDRRHWDAP